MSAVAFCSDLCDWLPDEGVSSADLQRTTLRAHLDHHISQTMAKVSSRAPSRALRQIAIDAPKYTAYRPLDAGQREIRVLDLGADLTCTLRHVSLTSSPMYYALSYYWCPPGSTKPLTIKSRSAEVEVVPIRKTVAKFLKSLYKQYGEITVWLDVICINQRSVIEQSDQVAIMGDIYRLAKAVFSWVRPWDPDTEHCFRYAAAKTSKRPAPEFNTAKVAASTEVLFTRPYWNRYVTQTKCAECCLLQQEPGSFKNAC